MLRKHVNHMQPLVEFASESCRKAYASNSVPLQTLKLHCMNDSCVAMVLKNSLM